MTIVFDEDKEERKLQDLKEAEEEDLVSILADAKYGIPYVNLLTMSIDNDALRLVDEAEARAIEVAPFKIVGKNLSLAVRAPERSEVGILKTKLETDGYEVKLFMVSKKSLEKVWGRYAELSHANTSRAGTLDIATDVIMDLKNKIKTIKDVEAIITEMLGGAGIHKISKMLEIILAGAIATSASDVHIEPEEEFVRLRYRLDGVLYDVMHFSNENYHLLNSRIKLLSGMKLTIKENAQDGRFSIVMGADEISIRASAIPGAYGESIVMRLLDPKSIRVKLEDLGIEPKLFEIIDKEIKKPNGMILLTGPTGSGKTTTLYAFLSRIYSPEIKIITIEDPIEYHLAGITQTQTEPAKGYTFIEGLKSALRQDPDVIMVGEIRDSETAKTAVESALTGHLVFSTLHTNNAAGVIPRLIDLEVNPKIMVSALSLPIAQRLVRRLCQDCKKERVATDAEKIKIKKILDSAVEEGKDLSFYGIQKDAEIKLWEAPGCDKCAGLGLKGQIGIFEAILIDENIEKIIPENPSEREIKKVADTQGILDMKEDGVIKALKGITTLAEVEGVVDFDSD